MSFVHCGGAIVPADEARVPALDAGLLYGDGVYETIRAYGGRPFALPRHLARLARSAARVRLALPAREDVVRAVDDVLAANGLSSAVVRVTVTRGRLARRLDLSSAGAPTLVVTADPVDATADADRARGVRVVYSRFLRLSAYPLAGVKSTNYQISLLARNEAREAGALEVLLPDETGAIVEAAAANVFVVEGRRLVTPPPGRGILAGVTREVVLECAEEAQLDISEETLPRRRLESAPEVFLTGTTIQVTPVVRVEDEPIADGTPGPVTLRLRELYLDRVAADTGAAIGPRAARA